MDQSGCGLAVVELLSPDGNWAAEGEAVGVVLGFMVLGLVVGGVVGLVFSLVGCGCDFVVLGLFVLLYGCRFGSRFGFFRWLVVVVVLGLVGMFGR